MPRHPVVHLAVAVIAGLALIGGPAWAGLIRWSDTVSLAIPVILAIVGWWYATWLVQMQLAKQHDQQLELQDRHHKKEQQTRAVDEVVRLIWDIRAELKSVSAIVIRPSSPPKEEVSNWLGNDVKVRSLLGDLGAFVDAREHLFGEFSRLKHKIETLLEAFDDVSADYTGAMMKACREGLDSHTSAEIERLGKEVLKFCDRIERELMDSVRALKSASFSIYSDPPSS